MRKITILNKEGREIVVIPLTLGVVGAIPSFLQEMYGAATASALLIITGLILLAIGFND